jgi:hypothetical protein
MSGSFQPIMLLAVQISLDIKYCGSMTLLPQGISRHTAERPLPLTQPFWLKSNWPIIRPSYNGNATSSTSSSRIHAFASRDRMIPTGMYARGIGSAS